MNLIHKEFLIALANGREVEFKYRGSWESIESSNCLGIFGNAAFEFRIKPQTTNISYEIPMPFVPEINDRYWYFNMSSRTGVYQTTNDGDSSDKRLIARGVYRTEKEAIRALAAHEAAVTKLLEGAK